MKIEFLKMKLRYVTLFLALLLFSNFINAQNTLDKITGLGSTNASVAYSLRLLSSSYAGPLVRIKVGTLFYDVYPDASNKFSLTSKISASVSTYNTAAASAGVNELSTIITGSTDATIAVWYDQSGYGIHVFSTTATTATAKIISQGTIYTINGQPTIFFNSTGYLVSSSTVDYSSQVGATVNAVVQNVATTSNVGGIIGTAYQYDQPGYGIAASANHIDEGYFSDGNGAGWYTGVLTTSPKILTDIFLNNTNTNSNFYVNGVLKSTTRSNASANIYPKSGSKIYIGRARGYNSFDFNGYISEAFIFPKIINTTERSAIETSQAIFLPPSVTITSNPTGSICPGATVTFTATTSNIATPSFQWYLNGVAITGATASTYSSTTLTNNDKITVIATPASASTSIVNGPNLKANLDAGNSSSYSGSGTTWTDLTGNGNKVTLTGTGYTNEKGGGITFNTSSTYGTQTFVSPPFNGDFTWSSIYKAPPLDGNGWDRIYSTGGYTAFHVGHVNGRPLFSFENWYPGGATLNTSGESTLTPGNYYMVTFVRSGNTLSSYVQASPYGTNGTATGAVIPVSPITVGKGPDGNAWENGVMNVMLIYNYALSQSEIAQNVNYYASRFGYSLSGYISNAITTTVSLTKPIITVNGEACTSKATLTTPTGLSSYAWYKDNVLIPSATSNSYVPSSIGEYQVQVSNGTCTAASLVTTIYNCVVNVNGKIVANSNVNASAINSTEGGTNFGTGKDISGKLFNTTGISSIIGTIGSTTAVIGGVISPTNIITTSIGVIYSTDINFGTYSTTTIQSNVAAGSYSSTISGLNSSTTYFAKSFIVNKAGTSYGPAISFSTTSPPIIAGSLYQGGVIAYVLQSGDPGYDASTPHGLIAAISDQSTGIMWSNNRIRSITGANGTAIGTGLANTNTIIASQGAVATSYAAGLARAYNGGGYNDWYLPSKNELNKLYLNKTVIGGFSSGYYFSSSEETNQWNEYDAWRQRFADGAQESGGYGKDQQLYVRAIRSF
ncbi:MAG: LamG-like jellyroll fold domain-containing protein [Chitinophagia bacterium]